MLDDNEAEDIARAVLSDISLRKDYPPNISFSNKDGELQFEISSAKGELSLTIKPAQWIKQIIKETVERLHNTEHEDFDIEYERPYELLRVLLKLLTEHFDLDKRLKQLYEQTYILHQEQVIKAIKENNGWQDDLRFYITTQTFYDSWKDVMGFLRQNDYDPSCVSNLKEQDSFKALIKRSKRSLNKIDELIQESLKRKGGSLREFSPQGRAFRHAQIECGMEFLGYESLKVRHQAGKNYYHDLINMGLKLEDIA